VEEDAAAAAAAAAAEAAAAAPRWWVSLLPRLAVSLTLTVLLALSATRPELAWLKNLLKGPLVRPIIIVVVAIAGRYFFGAPGKPPARQVLARHAARKAEAEAAAAQAEMEASEAPAAPAAPGASAAAGGGGVRSRHGAAAAAAGGL
jgi:hypothetical protein